MSKHPASPAEAAPESGSRTTEMDMHQITQMGRLASCMVRLSLQDLNTRGSHRSEAEEWFEHADSGAASLTFCSQALANLNRYLMTHAPEDRSAMPHMDAIMPEDVQSPAAWRDKIIEVADVNSLTPEAINQRQKAAQNIEALADALVDECREARDELENAPGIRGNSPDHLESDPSDPLDGPGQSHIMRL